jgi:hypothetical protein
MRARDTLSDPQLGNVDVYKVGLRSDLSKAWLHFRLGDYQYARSKLARIFRRTNLRRSYFNGYLAEPEHLPAGVGKVGRGWTATGALRSLARRIQQAP